MLSRKLLLGLCLLILMPMVQWANASVACAAESKPTASERVADSVLVSAIQRSLALLQTASAGSAAQRQCFTCHTQSHPVLAITQARRHGFEIDQENLDRQLLHTAAHLDRGRAGYLEGRGQGGQADTAGYALWTLQAGEVQSGETTDAVVDWLMHQQQEAGYWKRSSERPPSEASHFTTTYLALRGIGHFSAAQRHGDVAQQVALAQAWLLSSTAADTEDRVFRLLALAITAAPAEATTTAANELLATQRDDGGWAQTPSLLSDAYATGTALFALHQSGRLQASDPGFQKGLRYLIDSQLEDGSWHVVSRSVPFQAYYETGFPHGKDQFISTSATAWATLALLFGHRAAVCAEDDSRPSWSHETP